MKRSRARSAPFDPRRPTRLNRPILPESEIERIRRERREPRFTQWDYLHLEGLRRSFARSFRDIPEPTRPVLDLYCGTKPYLELIPWFPVWGMDLDRHFGRADVLGALPLPFRDGAFGIVLCSQALHLVDDPATTVQEMARILAPGGHVIVTIPHLFLAEGALERHWSREDLNRLFEGWEDVRVRGIDGPGAALAFVLGRLMMLATRRWRVMKALFTPSVVILNGIGAALDLLLAPVHRRWPHSLLLVACRPAKTQATGQTTSLNR
jgi:SAM-dependent methyltransferase